MSPLIAYWSKVAASLPPRRDDADRLRGNAGGCMPGLDGGSGGGFSARIGLSWWPALTLTYRGSSWSVGLGLAASRGRGAEARGGWSLQLTWLLPVLRFAIRAANVVSGVEDDQ